MSCARFCWVACLPLPCAGVLEGPVPLNSGGKQDHHSVLLKVTGVDVAMLLLTGKLC